MPGDSLEAAQRAAARFADPRSRHYWDRDGALARRMGRLLKLPGPRTRPKESGLGWDVFLAYAPGARWTREPPRPDYWTHQQMGVSLTTAPFLDPAKFRDEVKRLLARRPGKQR